MTDLTTPSLRPVTGPCAARHCEAPAVYDAGAGRRPPRPSASNAWPAAAPGRSPPTSSSPCSGCASTPPPSPRRGACAGLCDDPGDALRETRAPREDLLRIQALLEVHARWMEARLRRGGRLESPGDTCRYAEARLRGYRAEVFAALFLDARHRVIAFEPLFRGTVDGASVHPREVVRRALVHNAAAVILAHNHPSGVAEPSFADRAVTERLEQALATVDVRVLDHLVVGDGETVSFVERGWL